MGPNPAGIVLEGVLAFPGIILKVNCSDEINHLSGLGLE